MPITIPFNRNTDVVYGVAKSVSPLIRRVVAHNPGPFTFTGTGTYLVGAGEVAVIDPGPDLPLHMNALHAALQGERISHVLVTHTHSDHSAAAAKFAALYGAPACGFGPHGPRDLSDDDGIEEGADRDFTPDIRLKDGDVLKGPGWTLQAVHTPGHCSNHLCYALIEEGALFTGDHVMAWSTSIVSPPDGDMAAYLASLERLLDRADRIYYPTHGAAIAEPKPFVEALIAHRLEREQQIRDVLARGAASIGGIVEAVYKDVPKALHPAAARSVLAHLIHMANDGRVVSERSTGHEVRYRLP